MKLGSLWVMGLCVAAAAAAPPLTVDEKLATLLPLRASIYGTPLSGERELDATMAGKTEDQAQAIFKANQRRVRMGESFQLAVVLVKAGGATQPVTSDPRTKYVPNECLIASKSGFITVARTSEQCVPGMVSELMVAMDNGTQATAWNRFFFLITP